MANASKGRRSRKRRPQTAGGASKAASTAPAVTSGEAAPTVTKATSKSELEAVPKSGRKAASKSVPEGAPKAAPKGAPKARQKAPPPTRRGERPQAPWHPLPLSEILILIGAIATIVGLNRRSSGTALLVAGLVAVGIGTFEVTWREHSSGYRSHTILLALVPVLAFHSLVIAIASAFSNPTALLSIVLLPFDLALFYFFFKLLRARYLDARQLRTVGRR